MITRITYCAATVNMGDASDQDGDNYRAWAYAELEKEYPETCIGVYNSERSSACSSDCDYWKDQDNEEIQCYEFMSELWDRCHWSGEFFE